MMGDTLNIFHMDFNFVCLQPEYQRKWLRKIAEMGYNAVLWELEDKIRWESCPECVWPEAMSKGDFRELLAYSRELGLEPIPLLQTIGHAEYVLKHEPYHKLRELPDKYDCYCTSNPEARAFLIAWIEEYLDLFGEVSHFHLGGDEAYVFASCPKCAELAEKRGRNAVYAEHIEALAAPILEKGARPGIWCDMVMRHPDSLDAIPKKFVIWDWNYWDVDKTPDQVLVWGKGRLPLGELDDETKNAIPEIIGDDGNLREFYASKALKRMGYDVILCSASRSAGDTFLFARLLHAGNIVGAAKMVANENLLGNCVTSWAVRLNDFTVQTPFLGLAADALADPAKSSDELLKTRCDRLFGVASDKFIDALRMLSVSIPFAQAGTTGVQWDGQKGSVPAPDGFLEELLEKIDKDSPEALERCSVSIAEALKNIPEALHLLKEFHADAKSGYIVLEHMIAAVRFLLELALAGEKVLAGEKSAELAESLESTKEDFKHFLERRETPLSAAKNAGLVFDSTIDFFNGGESGK
jgi:hypothetical protein